MEVIEKERVTVLIPSYLAAMVRHSCTRDMLIPDIHEQAVRLWFSVNKRSWFRRLVVRLLVGKS